jgi:hypothetical protein
MTGADRSFEISGTSRDGTLAAGLFYLAKSVSGWSQMAKGVEEALLDVVEMEPVRTGKILASLLWCQAELNEAKPYVRNLVFSLHFARMEGSCNGRSEMTSMGLDRSKRDFEQGRR